MRRIKPEKLRKSLAASHLGFEKEPMDDFYGHPLLGFYPRFRVKMVLKELGDVGGKKVVDVGCEAGYVSLELIRRGAHTVSFDPCLEPLIKLMKKLRGKGLEGVVEPFLALAHAIPIKSRTADYVVCSEVIQLTPYLESLFSEFHRILRPGGKLVLTFPNESQKRRFYPIAKALGLGVSYQREVTPYHYSLEDVMKACQGKLEIIKVHKIPSSLLPLTTLIVCFKAASRSRIQ